MAPSVKSIEFGEILAAGEAIQEGIIVAVAQSTIINTNFHLHVAFDSRDLYSSLLTCRVTEDKSMRADVQLIRYICETKQNQKSPLDTWLK